MGVVFGWKAVRAWRGWAAFFAAGVFLFVRLVHLRAMPAFTDEATYARWAQLIAADPLHRAFLSMNDPKPPLHYWLLAATRWICADPILAGRILSVAIGLIGLLLLLPLGREMALCFGVSEREEKWFAGLAMAAYIACPMLNVLQRMVMAEPLLITEMLLIAWLSLRLAREANDHLMMIGSQRAIITGIWLGVAWAAALLTKQVFSYVLWLLPLVAIGMLLRRGGLWRAARRAAGPLALMSAIGLAVYLPVVLANPAQPLMTRLFFKPEFSKPIEASRLAGIWENLKELFVPLSQGQWQWWPHDSARLLESGILYVYLTPPVLLAILVAAGWMVGSGRWRGAAFLLVWGALMLGGPVGSGGYMFPRVLACGVVPVLLIVAWGAGQWMGRLRIAGAGRRAMAGGLLAAIGAWPMVSTLWTSADWQAPTLPYVDAAQCTSWFGGGSATECAIAFLQGEAAKGPIVVVTGDWTGTPNDMTWLSLSGEPAVHMYWHDLRGAYLRNLPGTAKFMLGSQLGVDKQRRAVEMGDAPMYLVVPIIHTPEVAAGQSFFPPEHVRANASKVASFFNPMPPGAVMANLEVAVYRVRCFDGDAGAPGVSDADAAHGTENRR